MANFNQLWVAFVGVDVIIYYYLYLQPQQRPEHIA